MRSKDSQLRRWNSSPHPISDIRDWNESDRLELRPDFQRLAVWSMPAKVMLIDTILRGIPMPKIFLANTIRNGSTYRVVIDGQQRILTILDFLKDNFALTAPYSGEEKGKRYSSLSDKLQDRILSYQIDFNEALNLTDNEVREVYARVNKYTVPLNKQELRRADFPGDFLNVVEKLAVDPFFDKYAIFTPASRRRYADVEYVSELLAGIIDGIQDKKTKLDTFYIRYANWESKHRKGFVVRFKRVTIEMDYLFSEYLNIHETRYIQKSDFYTFFLVINELISEGNTIIGKDVSPLIGDLDLLDLAIRPESVINICSEYAIKCVSQANSASSRRFRHHFIKSILARTYTGCHLDKFGIDIYYEIREGLDNLYDMCPPETHKCPVCEEEISDPSSEGLLAWTSDNQLRQITNSNWIHISCKNNSTEWVALERPSDDQPNLL